MSFNWRDEPVSTKVSVHHPSVYVPPLLLALPGECAFHPGNPVDTCDGCLTNFELGREAEGQSW